MRLYKENGMLVIDLTFWEKVWSIHGSFRIPLKNIREIRRELPPSTWKELRIPGTFVPGFIKAGTYINPRGKEFWYVTRGNPQHLTIELDGEKYKRIVLSLPESEPIPFHKVRINTEAIS